MTPTQYTTQNWNHPCTLLRARLIPARAGADTQAVIHIPLSQLRQLPDAPELEAGWIRARVGQDGYLTGQDAQTAACDAQTASRLSAGRGTTSPMFARCTKHQSQDRCAAGFPRLRS